MRHDCPFCGKEIKKEDVLFVRDGNDLYPDIKRQRFLSRSCHAWEFNWDPTDPTRALFSGTYYRPMTVEKDLCKVITIDQDDFPRTIRVSATFMGLKPDELEASIMEDEEEEEEAAETIEEAPAATTDMGDFGDLGAAFSSLGGLTPEPAAEKPKTQKKKNTASKPSFSFDDDETIQLSNRACPYCHSRLPVLFGQLQTVNISLIGGRAAGKTAFLISMVHQLNQQLGARNLGSAVLLPESQEYYELQNRYFQAGYGNPMATPAADRLFPFVFEYRNHRGNSCFVAINDVAGEGMEKMDYLLNHKGLYHADILLLMLDPNMLCDGLYAETAPEAIAARRKAEEIALETGEEIFPSDSHECFSKTIPEFFDRSLNQLRSFGLLNNIRHVIAVTTKIDLPLTQNPERFRGNCEMKYNLSRNNKLEHVGGFDLDVLSSLEKAIAAFYMNPGSSINSHYDIKKLVSNTLPNVAPQYVRLMAVSTRTRQSPEDAHEIIFTNEFRREGPKHRIIEPFLLCLALKELIPWQQGGVIQPLAPWPEPTREPDADPDPLPGPTPDPGPTPRPTKKKGFFARLFGGDDKNEQAKQK